MYIYVPCPHRRASQMLVSPWPVSWRTSMVFKTKEAVQNYGLPGQISRPPSTQFVSIQLEVRGSGLSGRAFFPSPRSLEGLNPKL